MYVAVKGGEKAIDNAHALLALKRRGDKSIPELSVAQIQQQMSMAVARVMSEGSLYDPELAALAIKQSAGDLLEAIFLLRAYRTTLVRFAHSVPIDTEKMCIERRISATYKDLPGGQLLGPTFDYTHRLLDFKLLAESDVESIGQVAPLNTTEEIEPCNRVLNILEQEGLMRREQDQSETVSDITREPLDFPSNRMQRLQALARGDEGFLMALAYSTQRGYGRNHPFAGEIRIGEVEVWFEPEELDFPVPLGDIEVTECEMVNQFIGSKSEGAQFTRGYGLGFGYNERKAMSMALVDRALCSKDFGEEVISPAQEEEFVLMHCDNVEAAGFVSHLKLPHYVDFQSELELIRKMQIESQANEQCDESLEAEELPEQNSLSTGEVV